MNNGALERDNGEESLFVGNSDAPVNENIVDLSNSPPATDASEERRPGDGADGETALFVEDTTPTTTNEVKPNNEGNGTFEQIGDVQRTESQEEPFAKLPSLDPVQLASIVKNFNAPKDPLFARSPDYMAAIVKEMLQADFLLVLGRGLGLNQVLQLFLGKVKQVTPRALVLVLGKRSDGDETIEAEDPSQIREKPAKAAKLEENDMDEEDSHETIGFGLNSAKRTKLYRQGGIYNITAPIAVVDILTGALDCSTISGLVIAHGENVSENSTAAFFIRLVRERNSVAFIKALCDAPERLVLPPSLPVRLRTLGVKTVMLWPRFHLAVDRSLPRLEVDEIIIEQSPVVRRQQALLSELMQAVLSDVKCRVPHLDVEYLAPTLGGQQPHESPEHLHSTTTADAVLASPDLPYRIRNALQGIWHQLSWSGKKSVHSLGTLQQLQHTLSKFDALSFWSQLDFACRDTSEPWVILPATDALVAEARSEAASRRPPGKFPHVKELIASFPAGEKTLLLCDSPKTIFELHEYLSHTEEELQENEQLAIAMEKSMREADEEKVRKRAAEQAAKVNESRPGRRRVRGGMTAPAGSGRPQTEVKIEVDEGTGSTTTTSENTLNGASSLSLQQPSPAAVVEPAPLKRRYEEIDLTSVALDQNDTVEFNAPYVQARVIFATYRGSKPLAVIKPKHVIMYDPNLQFTREVERYSATISDKASRPTIHFIYYQKSVEELQYLTEMRREKDAFTRLIREKGLMPMVLRDGDTPGGGINDEIRIVGDSRRRYVVQQRQRVVVDTREFRSALPFLIWQSRLDVVPVTLLVGDYVLTPDIVVERKSVTDLIGSFRDGRLYAQCESMQKHYKVSVLLVEFDNLSHFSMEPFKDIRSRQSADVQREIQENICALLLRFPKLKLIWSASPLHSAEIFKGLKEMEPEPEPEECAKAGTTVMFDSLALSMLEAMPGITPRNSHLIAKKASTIAALCELSKQDMVDALGPENGEKLFRFISFTRDSQ